MAENLSAAYYRALAMANEAIGEAIVKFGPDTTYHHIMSVLAERAARELPEGMHYLRNAVDRADASAAADKKAREEWDLARESGYYSLPKVIRPRSEV